MSEAERKTRWSTRAVALACAGVVLTMTGAAFAAVPLYQLFCQVTGFGGTTMRADKPSDVVLDRTIKVRFDTNVRNLPMTFRAEQVTQTVRIGETGLAYFDVTNTSDEPIAARASYNVVPEQTGQYFQKLQCFCFDDQTIEPGQTIQFPVQYYVDPKLAENAETDGVDEITLSYTFYPSAEDAPATGAG
ncbi:MAG: cytochrome c oxidase assembly protein [Caulobacteraceae bacterium]|nr:cytochrome c oxidase assembly protein [Caulobacteraceae bacterium]